MKVLILVLYSIFSFVQAADKNSVAQANSMKHDNRYYSSKINKLLKHKSDEEVATLRDALLKIEPFKKHIQINIALDLKKLKNTNNYDRKTALNILMKHTANLKGSMLINPSLMYEISEKIKKGVFHDDPNKQAQLMISYVFLEDIKIHSIGDACSIAIDKCGDNAFCREVKIEKNGKVSGYQYQCVSKVDYRGQCNPNYNQCVEGECRKLNIYSDINTCEEINNSCKANKDCCSGVCDSKKKKCIDGFICISCTDIGQKVQKHKQCCPSLYPNLQGVCVPIYPYSYLDRGLKFLGDVFTLLSNTAQASDSVDSIKSQISSRLGTLRSELGKAGVSNVNVIINDYSNRMRNCGQDSDGSIISEQMQKICLNGVLGQIESGIESAKTIATANSNFADSIKDFKKGAGDLGSIRSEQYNMGNMVSHYNSTKNRCYQRTNMITSGSGSWNDASAQIASCINSISNNVKNRTMEMQTNKAVLLQGVTGGDVKDGIIQQGTDESDYSLYTNYKENVPLLSTISISDMKNCRVNLFGDYLAKQNDEYFSVMITLLGMDYVTSGLDTNDYFTLSNWNYQTQTQEQDIETFNQRAIKNDIFVGLTDEVAKSINDYYATLNEVEKKIWAYLFANSVMSNQHRGAIIEYFMTGKTLRVENVVSSYSLPPALSYNIHMITRFEAVKFKFHLFQLYGKLKQKSIEIMCRCVDTMGPMNGDPWLKEDVEQEYLRFCAGQGKYDKFVLKKDTTCDYNDKDECIQAEDKGYVEELREAEAEHINKNIIATDGGDVEYIDPLNRDINDEIQNDEIISELRDLTTAPEKTSKADKFIVDGRVTFEAEMGDNQRGHAHGVEFSALLRDMSIMKADALSQAAVNNVFSISSTLTATSNFVKMYNWGYQKTKVIKYEKTKKYTWIELIFAWTIQLITLFQFDIMAEDAGFNSSAIISGTKFKYDGKNANIASMIKDSLSSLHLRPSNICEKKKYKSKTWKVAKIPIGKIYYYRCIRNEIQPNNVCNEKMPVGLCLKSVYATDDDGYSSFIIDPFIPHNSSMNKKDNFLKTKTVNTLTDVHKEEIKKGAADYLKSQFFEFTDDEAAEFGELVYRYHFWYPKKAHRIRYMTQGLVPYYENLVENAFAMNMAIMSDLFLTSSYALKMHNTNVRVIEGLRGGIFMNKEFIEVEEVEEQDNDLELFDFMAAVADAGAFEGGDLDFDTWLEPIVKEGQKSESGKVREFAGAMSAMLKEKTKRQREKINLEKHMSDNGRLDELRKLHEEKEKKLAPFKRAGSKFARAVRVHLSNGNDDMFSRLEADRKKSRSKKKKDEKNDEKLAENIAVDMLGGDGLKSKSDGKSSSSKSSSDDTNTKDGGEFRLGDVDLSDLDDMTVAGFQFGKDGKLMRRRDVKAYMEGQRLADKRLKDNNEYLKNPEEWERDNISLFDKVTKRYQRSGFRKLMLIKKK
jgi:hypothetical protein